MSQINSTGTSISINDLAHGDKRLKRVALNIKRSIDPERAFPGYALVNELNEKMFYFFCTDKFKIDEELMVYFNVAGQDLELQVVVSSLHEQISSGRIMTSVPSAENPFPARKFYRCFAKVLAHNMHSREDLDSQMDELDALVSADGEPSLEATGTGEEATPQAEPTEVAAAAPAAEGPAPDNVREISMAPKAPPSNPFEGAPAPTDDPALLPKAA